MQTGPSGGPPTPGIPGKWNHFRGGGRWDGFFPYSPSQGHHPTPTHTHAQQHATFRRTSGSGKKYCAQNRVGRRIQQPSSNPIDPPGKKRTGGKAHAHTRCPPRATDAPGGSLVDPDGPHAAPPVRNVVPAGKRRLESPVHGRDGQGGPGRFKGEWTAGPGMLSNKPARFLLPCQAPWLVYPWDGGRCGGPVGGFEQPNPGRRRYNGTTGEQGRGGRAGWPGQ